MLAPSATPRGIVSKLAAETARIIELPDVREPMLNQGATPKASAPQVFEKLVRTEIETRKKVFAAAGTRVD
jgi:tripartite-type tricarboxylate transporter receptor subunit TctC